VKIKAYEEMVQSIKQFEDDRNTEGGQLEAAAAEVDTARQRLNALLDKALENPEEHAADVGKAQGMVTIAETRLQRLKAKLEAENRAPGKQFPNSITVAFQNVQSEIRRRIADGSLIEEAFTPILDELNGHRKAYMEKLEAIFMKMHELNKTLEHIQHSTASAVTRYTDKDVRFGITGPEVLSESHFKEWAWVYQYAYDEDLGKIRKRAMQSADPSTVLPPANVPKDKVTIKDSTAQMTTTYTKI
jgi:DNA repair exonuclease SbcCD ATPase subunit